MGVAASQLIDWEETGEITFDQLEKLAEKTYTPLGFLFLTDPPSEVLPIADFRRSQGPGGPPSPDLLDVLHSAQRRQEWYRNYLVENGAEPLGFVGSASIKDSVSDTAKKIREVLPIGSKLAENAPTLTKALQLTIEAIEDVGILVLRAGFAGGYTRRKLSVDEFRGFALSDPYAPLVFINGADAPAAQIFTLAHEVAHIWLGESGVFNLDKTYANEIAVEDYCNRVAAEVLVPAQEFVKLWNPSAYDSEEIERLATRFAVSGLVIARRARDSGLLSQAQYNNYYAKVMIRKKGGRGDWYLNTQYQNSRRFSVALIRAAKEGKTLYHDAMQLLGIKKDATFRKYANSLQLSF